MEDLLESTELGCFDFQGHPISIRAWCDLSHEVERRVGLDCINGVEISTVWIGVDVSQHEPPQIYETLVTQEGDPSRLRRYATREEAHAGHQEYLVSARLGRL